MDVVANRDTVARAIGRLHDVGIVVSLFVDPEPEQLELAAELGADAIELHTGAYALASARERDGQLAKLANAGQLARTRGLTLHAGHGLTYRNVRPIAALEGMHELNIGHSIIARAIMVGLQQAVREMKELLV